MSTNGTQNYDLYAATPALAQPLPEAAFSLSLKGTLNGQDALLTVRGATIAEFQANVQAVKGLLDSPQAGPPHPTATDLPRPTTAYCAIHKATMTLQDKNGRRWFSHRVSEDGQWCKGR
jgi:hypothetical protein